MKRGGASSRGYASSTASASPAARTIFEIELRLVGRVELGDPGDERPVERDERRDLDEPVRLDVELGRKLEGAQVGLGQGAEPFLRVCPSRCRCELLRAPHGLPIPSPIARPIT